MIKGGGVATVSVSQYELGKLTGKMAAQELRGKNPATMPVETVKKVLQLLIKNKQISLV